MKMHPVVSHRKLAWLVVGILLAVITFFQVVEVLAFNQSLYANDAALQAISPIDTVDISSFVSGVATSDTGAEYHYQTLGYITAHHSATFIMSEHTLLVPVTFGTLFRVFWAPFFLVVALNCLMVWYWRALLRHSPRQFAQSVGWVRWVWYFNWMLVPTILGMILLPLML